MLFSEIIENAEAHFIRLRDRIFGDSHGIIGGAYAFFRFQTQRRRFIIFIFFRHAIHHLRRLFCAGLIQKIQAGFRRMLCEYGLLERGGIRQRIGFTGLERADADFLG